MRITAVSALLGLWAALALSQEAAPGSGAPEESLHLFHYRNTQEWRSQPLGHSEGHFMGDQSRQGGGEARARL